MTQARPTRLFQESGVTFFPWIASHKNNVILELYWRKTLIILQYPYFPSFSKTLFHKLYLGVMAI